MGGSVLVICGVFLVCILSIPEKASGRPLPHQYELCTQIKTHVHHHDEKGTATTAPPPTTTSIPDDIRKELQKRIKQFRKAFKSILSLEIDQDEAKKKAEAQQKEEEEKKKKEEEEKKKKEEEEKKKKEEEAAEESRGFNSVNEFFDVYMDILRKVYYSF